MAQKPDALQDRLASVLDGADVRVAVAESLTGGELSARFASASGAGDWFRGGIVAYASAVKYDLLDVPEGPVVSGPAAAAMAAGACRLLKAQVAVAVTGVGGPDEPEKRRAEQDGHLEDQSPVVTLSARPRRSVAITRHMSGDGPW